MSDVCWVLVGRLADMKRTGGNGGEEKIRDVKMVRFGKTWGKLFCIELLR